MHEYAIGFADALKMPCARAFALRAIIRERLGGKRGGPDYYERISVSKYKAEGLI